MPLAMKAEAGPRAETLSPQDRAERLVLIYRLLYEAYGPQHWWPGDSPFEVMVGAILTQSAAWTNVEKAIGNLKQAGVLSAPALRSLPLEGLARLLYPSGYYNAKATKVKALTRHLARYDDDLDRLFDQDLESLRGELLGIHGIGEETADSIILYAAGKPSFVIDAYTRRIVDRLGLLSARTRDTEGRAGRVAYSEYQALFADHLPADERLFNEYHALLVRLGKNLCRKAPLCPQCPLLGVCPMGQATVPPAV